MRQLRRVQEFNAYLAHHVEEEEFSALDARARQATDRYAELRDDWLRWLGGTVDAAEALLELLSESVEEPAP